MTEAAACARPATRRVDPDEFRGVMRYFPTGVTVLTVTGPAGPHGMTANAVMSVSLTPPTALAAVHHGTNTHAILRTASSFSINILAADQQDLAELFARSRPETDPFCQVPWQPSAVTGNPVLTQSLAVLDCRLEQRITVADHSLIVGAVVGTRVDRPETAPMVFARGEFRTVTPP